MVPKLTAIAAVGQGGDKSETINARVTAALHGAFITIYHTLANNLSHDRVGLEGGRSGVEHEEGTVPTSSFLFSLQPNYTLLRLEPPRGYCKAGLENHHELLHVVYEPVSPRLALVIAASDAITVCIFVENGRGVFHGGLVSLPRSIPRRAANACSFMLPRA